MKLINTRIRVESSNLKTEYFPEYQLEWKTWYGKVKQEWYSVDNNSSHHFGTALHHTVKDKYTLEWAQEVINLQAHYYKQHVDFNEHQNTKETSYVKYP